MTSPGVSFRCQHEIPNIASIWTLHFRCFPAQHSRICSRVLELRPGTGWRLRCGRLSSNGARKLLVRASDGSVISNGSNTAAEDAPKADKGDPFAKFQGIIRSVPTLISNWNKSAQDALKAEKGDPFAKFQGIISSMPPLVIVLKRNSTASFAIGFCLATVLLFIVGRINAARKAKHERPGSVADLVKRGQLRSDRRGISRPLKYEDPFNNPLVKVGKKNSTVEICGKVYRLAPVTLTEEEQAIHKKRRSRAYQWKRPTMFLKEGDTIPPDVDPDTVRWIPANHPFATTANDIDEDLAQTNVYQKHGVPFRIQAEHEALQRKLEALQRDEKLDKLVIDRSNAKDFERPYKFQTKAQDAEHSSSDNQAAANSEPPKSKSDQRSSGGNSFPEDIQKP